MYKAIIFDFFDVIRTDTYKAWLNKYGYKLEGPFLEVNQRMDRGEIKVDEFLKVLGKISGQAPDTIFKEMEADAVVDYEVLKQIEALGNNYKLGLLSNAPSDFIRALLREHDIGQYFDEIVISSEVGLIKPRAEIFNHMLEKLDVQPHEAIFIDDNSKNTAGAEAIGIASILFTSAVDLKIQLTKFNINF